MIQYFLDQSKSPIARQPAASRGGNAEVRFELRLFSLHSTHRVLLAALSVALDLPEAERAGPIEGRAKEPRLFLVRVSVAILQCVMLRFRRRLYIIQSKMWLSPILVLSRRCVSNSWIFLFASNTMYHTHSRINLFSIGYF